ncbi:MAG: DUF4105 domain-containing protein [Bdellovibrionota bacterium]
MLTSYLKSNLNSRFGKALLWALFFVCLKIDSAYAVEPVVLDTQSMRSWKNLLFYSSRWIGDDTSLVDSPTFFLARNGASDAQAELNEFLSRLRTDTMNVPEEQRISCRFPARVAWVREKLPDFDSPKIDCPLYQSWLSLSQPFGLSLIFSSYFVNNPSSMMGHTFLRIRRGDAKSSPLLDQSVNFAAAPTHDIPILYNIDGLIGGFPGLFSMLHYYVKVQEYANAESRDLWEYDLAFNQAETLRVMASLWEIAPQRIDYYFFDENCSAVLLYLVQTGRTNLYVSRRLGSWVHPSDTLRYLMEEGDIVKGVVYRPSTRSRYLAQRDLLRVAERDLAETLVKKQSLADEEYLSLPEDRQALLLDTLIAFIEFDENLHGAKKAKRHTALYDEILKARASLSAAPLTHFPTPELEAPHLGHKGRRLGFALGQFENNNELQFEYRPGQHDLLSPAIGYPPELSIQLGKTRLAFEKGKTARIRSAEFFHIQSFNPSRSGRLPWSWQLQNNFENTDAKRFNLFGSIGQSWSLGSREDFAFLMFDSRAKVERAELWGCPGLSTGGRFSVLKRFVSFTQIGVERCYSKETKAWTEHWSQEFRYSYNDAYEVFAEARKYVDAREYTLGFYRYY